MSKRLMLLLLLCLPITPAFACGCYVKIDFKKLLLDPENEKKLIFNYDTSVIGCHLRRRRPGIKLTHEVASLPISTIYTSENKSCHKAESRIPAVYNKVHYIDVYARYKKWWKFKYDWEKVIEENFVWVK